MAALLLIGAAGPALAAHPDRAVVAKLDADGDADLSVTYTFDLDSDAEREAFQQLENESVREAYRTRFEDRLAAVAENASRATSREMAVSDASVDVESDDGTGIVTLSVTWTNLAAVSGDRLVVTEPFASGFVADRPLAIVPPDGYRLADASPRPDSTDGHPVWRAGTTLDGFAVTFEPAATTGNGDAMDGTDQGTTGNTGPGFGLAATLAGLVAAGLIAARHNNRQ